MAFMPEEDRRVEAHTTVGAGRVGGVGDIRALDGVDGAGGEEVRVGGVKEVGIGSSCSRKNSSNRSSRYTLLYIGVYRGI